MQEDFVNSLPGLMALGTVTEEGFDRIMKARSDAALAAECEHKYVFRNNDSWYRSASRYSFQYVSIDYYYCEKCLHEQEVKKEVTLGDHEVPDRLPDWARGIKTRV